MTGSILQTLIEDLLPQPIAEEIVPHIFDYDELKCNLRFINIRPRFRVKIPHLLVELVKDAIIRGNQRFRLLHEKVEYRADQRHEIRLYPDSVIWVGHQYIKYEQSIDTPLVRNLVFVIVFWFKSGYPKPYYTAYFDLRDNHNYPGEAHYRETFDPANGYSIMYVGDDMDAKEFMERSWFYRYFE